MEFIHSLKLSDFESYSALWSLRYTCTQYNFGDVSRSCACTRTQVRERKPAWPTYGTLRSQCMLCICAFTSSRCRSFLPRFNSATLWRIAISHCDMRCLFLEHSWLFPESRKPRSIATQRCVGYGAFSPKYRKPNSKRSCANKAIRTDQSLAVFDWLFFVVLNIILDFNCFNRQVHVFVL